MNSLSLSRLLARSGLVLVVFYVIIILFDVLPPKILQPDWILSFAFTVSNTLTLPLVGILLVQLAAYVEPKQLGKLQVRIARFSAVLALVFLLIQPMLVFALWKNNRDLSSYNQEQINLINAKGNQLNQAIQKAATFEELQSSMARLQGPAIPEQARSISLPKLKEQLLTSVKSAQAAFPSRLNTPTSPAYRDVYKRLARTSLLSLVGLVCFSFLSWNPITDKNILLTYFQSIGLFGITPASLQQSFGTFWMQYKSKRMKESQMKVSRQSVVRHQQQIRKAQEKQMREQKRREIAEQRQMEKMRRERERLQELERKMERKQELEGERERQRRGE